MLAFVAHASDSSEPITEFTYTSATKDSIEINGTKRFVEQVSRCLDLIAKNDNKNYQFINQYIGEIKQHHTSGIDVEAKPPRFEMSSKTAFYSLTWCASSIAHDAYHSYLYQKHRAKHGAKAIPQLWTGYKAESKSIHFQRRVAQKIGAPKTELNYLLNLKGSHSDLNGDGRFSHDDYEKRDW